MLAEVSEEKREAIWKNAQQKAVSVSKEEGGLIVVHS